MKHLRSWGDLRPYGIDVLTGESCAYGYRLLCDIDATAQRLLMSVFGLNSASFSFTPAWNHDGDWRSVMLPRAMFEPLAVFACFEVDHCSKVYITYEGAVYGVEATDSPESVAEFVRWNQGRYCEACHRYGAGDGINLQYSNPGYARHQHQMSGRTS